MYIYNVGFRNGIGIDKSIYVYDSIEELFEKELGDEDYKKEGNEYYSKNYVVYEYEIKKGKIFEIIE